jgi:hypothetical protein
MKVLCGEEHAGVYINMVLGIPVSYVLLYYLELEVSTGANLKPTYWICTGQTALFGMAAGTNNTTGMLRVLEREEREIAGYGVSGGGCFSTEKERS